MARISRQINRHALLPPEQFIGFGTAAALVNRCVQQANYALDQPMTYWRETLEKRREAAAQAEVERSSLRSRLLELWALQPGWLDGAGEAIDRAVLRRVQLLLDQLTSRAVPRPHVFPTPEGGVQLEWSRAPREISVTLQPDEVAYALSVNVETGETDEWQLVVPGRPAETVASLVLHSTR